jgi:hypothetical protein
MVLLEWKTKFGDNFGIRYDFDPRVLLLDRDGVIRLRHRGAMTDRALARVLTVAAELDAPAAPRGGSRGRLHGPSLAAPHAGAPGLATR